MLAILRAQAIGLGQGGGVLLGRRLQDGEPLLVQQLGRQHLRVAAQDDVGPAARHVGGDHDVAAAPGLGDDLRLLLVELGVEDAVLDAPSLEHLAQHLADLDADRADQDRPALLVLLDDLVDHGAPLALLAGEDQVGEVVPDHRLVGGDRDHLEVVDLVELLRLGLGRSGHAGELVVHPEVVLEGDRRQGARLVLDLHPLLGLDRLVQPLAPAPSRHQATGELVDDHDLVVLYHVVAVALVERLRLERLLEVAGHREVVVEEVVDPQPLLHLVGAGLGDRHLAELLVEDVVLDGLQPGDQSGELDVLVGRFLGRPGDDQRRPRLVDEDVVDLVHDREEVPALDALAKVDDQVVAQVVEAELVVRPVGHVSGVRLAPRHRPQRAEVLIGLRELRVDDVGGLVLDGADAHPQPPEDLADPLRVALGEVVVDRHHVDPAAGQAVEIGGQRGHEGLPFARLHLGDGAGVQHHPPDQLDVVVALGQGAPHGLADGRERVRQDLVEHGVDLLPLPLVLLLALFADAGRIAYHQLRLGGLLCGQRALLDGDQQVAQLVAQAGAELLGLAAQVGIGEGGVLRLELVDAGNGRFEATDLAIIRVRQPGEELQHLSGRVYPDGPMRPVGAISPRGPVAPGAPRRRSGCPRRSSPRQAEPRTRRGRPRSRRGGCA